MMRRFIVLFLLSATFLYGGMPLEKVSLKLQWADQFQFAGYYVAKEKGFYREAGLDVALQKFEPTKIAVDEVLSGRSDYGIGRSSLLLDRMNGKPVVALAAIFQKSPFVLLSEKSAGIKTPRDLIGKRVMMTKDFQDTIAIRAMLNSQGVGMEQLKLLTHSYNPSDIANGKTDAMACYISNEPFALKEKGIETSAISPDDYGFDFYSDILFTSEKELKEHPRRVRAFVDASLRGWEYALAHIPETAKLIKERYNSQNKSLRSLIYEGEKLKELAYNEGIPLGAINREKLERIADIYRVMGAVREKELDQTFLYEDVDTIPSSLTIEEREFLHSHTIRYTSTFAWPPFNFRSDEKSSVLEGIAADFWDLIVTRTGMKATFIPSATWQGVLHRIKTKTADITLGTSISAEKQYAIFSKPYATFPNVIVTNKGINFLPGLSALEGKRIAIGEGYGIAKTISDAYPKITIVPVEDTREGLKLLSRGEVDAAVDILPVVAYLINADQYTDLKISGTTEFNFDVRMMIRNDYPLLKSIVDKMIGTIDPAERQQIFNRYIAVMYEKQIDYTWTVRLLLMTAALMILLLYRHYEMGKYNEKLLQLAITDPLTKLYNRVKLDEKLLEYQSLYYRSNRPFSIILIDLDFFKRVNDTFGHLVGDRILEEFASLLKMHIRKTDIAGRWGGEEFMIICPETSGEGALHLAQTIQKVIHDHEFHSVTQMTCSCGISEFRENDQIESVVKRADNALYEAKESGRNRIVLL